MQKFHFVLCGRAVLLASTYTIQYDPPTAFHIPYPSQTGVFLGGVGGRGVMNTHMTNPS